MSIRGANSSRGERTRRIGLMAAVALLPALAGCSSSSSVDYVADTYPSRSLVDVVKSSMNSPPPRPDPAPSVAMAAPPAPTSSTVPPPAQDAAAAPSVAAPVAPAAPAPPAAAPGEADPVAAAYPSVSLIDVLASMRKPAQ